MDLYGIRRRSCWANAEELEIDGKRSAEVGDKPDSGVRWIRSYVVQEDDGRLGTYCIYEATGPDAIRKHAEEAGFSADEINRVADTVVVRPDPQPAAAG
jgi:Protein of unknown function (DUF4242)